MNDLPSYDDLPVTDGAPPGSSWGIWGSDDVFGCLNLLTSERVQRGAACVRRGVVFSLNLELELPDPPLHGRPPMIHEAGFFPNSTTVQDETITINTQSSSQWDGFRHVGSANHGFYNGVANKRHGVHHWARRGIAGRAILADVARWRAAQNRALAPLQTDPIEPSDVLATLEAQRTSVETGDVLLIRTGWLSAYRALDTDGRASYAAQGNLGTGLRPGTDTARMLWDLHIAAVAADNHSLECWPPGAVATPEQLAAISADKDALMEVFVHMSILPMLGLPIGELWDLDALAEDCAADGVYECFLTSAPLNLDSGVASPPNALALK